MAFPHYKPDHVNPLFTIHVTGSQLPQERVHSLNMAYNHYDLTLSYFSILISHFSLSLYCTVLVTLNYCFQFQAACWLAPDSRSLNILYPLLKMFCVSLSCHDRSPSPLAKSCHPSGFSLCITSFRKPSQVCVYMALSALCAYYFCGTDNFEL